MKALTPGNNRIESIDLLRGIVMIIMALDHVRLYLHFDSLVFSPTDLQHTRPALFTTRLITHLCAPTFVFLAGTSAYFIAQRKTLKDTSIFLLSRGLWLIILQFTLIRFAWNFDPLFHFNSSNIISTIGFSMIAMAGLIRLSLKKLLVIGLIILIGHNTLDGVSFAAGSAADVIWSFLHVRKLFVLDDQYSFQFLYPVLPWIGIMALGYCLGRLYDSDYPTEKRIKTIQRIGISSLIFFVVLRSMNIYGDPMAWADHQEISVTVMSFFNLEKYPPSFLFACLTLGISLLLLSFLENRRVNSITIFGKTALFYYVLHIFVIHAMAMVAAVANGFPWQTMIFIGANNQASPLLKGRFGFSLITTYIMWMCVVLLLYPLCALLELI